MENAQAILDAGGASLDGVRKAAVYPTDIDDFVACNEADEPYPETGSKRVRGQRSRDRYRR